MSLADFQSGNLRSSSGDLRPRHFAITRWRLDRIFFFCAFENFNWAVPLVQTAHGCRKQSVLYERQVGARTRSYSENWHTPQRRFTRSVESCTCTGRNGVTTPIGKPVFLFLLRPVLHDESFDENHRLLFWLARKKRQTATTSTEKMIVLHSDG